MYSSFFSSADLIFFPFAILLLYGFIRLVEKKETRLLLTAFWIHVFAVVIHALIVQYYYGTGDTTRYYTCILDMRAALSDGAISLRDILESNKLDPDSHLASYFSNDVYAGQNFYYMQAPSNYSVVRIGTLISLLFSTNYLPISLCFSFFALMGSWALYKTICKLYPTLKREMALALLFIPTVVFWSSSILKDPITFGSLGFILFGIYLALIKKKPIAGLLFIIPPAYITYLLKSYILISFAPAVILLVFLSRTQRVKHRGVRNMYYIVMMAAAVGLGFLLFQNLTSKELANQYQTDQLFEKIDAQRSIYGQISKSSEGSYFAIESSNPLVVLPAGVMATFFRPFIWEIQNPVMLLSALESLLFSLLTIYVFFKVGVGKVFNKIFSVPAILFCFVFSILFGAAVGASTGNFGSLVRYKIPGMPFFFIMLLLLLFVSGTAYPRWFRAVVNKVKV